MSDVCGSIDSSSLKRRRGRGHQRRLGPDGDDVDVGAARGNIESGCSSSDNENEPAEGDEEADQHSETAASIEPKRSRPKYTYLRFKVDSLRNITSNSVRSGTQPDKFTSIGQRYNMCFKLVKSDSRIIKSFLYAYGFMQCSRKNPNVNVIWANTHFSRSTLQSMLPWQRMNHFPLTKLITKKDALNENLKAMKDFFPNQYGFFPKSFVLPEELETLKACCDAPKPPTFIVKPAASSRGRGIKFVRSVDDIQELKEESHNSDARNRLVVSEYITDVLLVNNLKFDLRIYVAVTSFKPLIVYQFNEGLARFATVEYAEPLDGEKELNPWAHLTNYSLNKDNPEFVKNIDPTDGGVGHKWYLSNLLQHLHEQGHDTELLMVRIEDIVIKTLLSIQSQVNSVVRSTGLGPNTCFELFGFDILVDANLKPWLLEVNLSPSLSCDSPLDSVLKAKVVCDTLNLAMIPLAHGSNVTNVSTDEVENDPGDDTDFDTASMTASMTSDTTPIYPEHSTLGGTRGRSLYLTSRLGPMNRRRLGNARFKKSPSTDVKTNLSMSARIRTSASRIRCEKTRVGDFVRIFPREDTFHLYEPILREIDTKHDRADTLCYELVFGSVPRVFKSPDSDSDSMEVEEDDSSTASVHFELTDCENHLSRLDLSDQALFYLQGALEQAEDYRKTNFPKGTIAYPKRLPRIRSNARRRTASQEAADELRRTIRLEGMVVDENKAIYVDNAPHAHNLDHQKATELNQL